MEKHDELFREAIRNPTSGNANAIFDETVPEIVKPLVPDMISDLEKGTDPEIMAEKSLDGIIDVVEEEVLGDGVDFVLENFGDRIVDLMSNGFFGVFEKVTMLIVGG